MQRVVITGMGIYSCIGVGKEEVAKSLYAGRSGIGIDPIRKEMGFRSSLTGVLPETNLKGLLDRRQRIGLAQHGEFAYLSTLEALTHAKLDADYLDKCEAGIIFGSDSSALAVVQATDIIRQKKDTSLVGSGSIFQSMNSTVTMNLSTIFKLKGINFTLSAACASSSHAIGVAYLMIRQGLQDVIVCGGAQEVNEYAMGNFDGLGAFSTRESEPSKASRPFDKHRDGLVPSGGSASIILESYESAKKRGANILAEVIGYGFSSNGGHISHSSVDGLYRSMNVALKDARLSPAEIDFVSAHATSTPEGDSKEAEALNQMFGASKPPVCSTKGMTGHECWMAGASELVYTMLMMDNEFVAPNMNMETPDDAAVDLNLPTESLGTKIDVALSNSFGFGGTNSTLVIKKSY